MLKRIHLIGVCGTAMATLAALLKSKGYDVRGSDQNVYPPMSDFLVDQGITTFQGYSAANITPDLDLVVVGNAISRGNVELEEVLDRKIRYCSLPEAIRDHFLWAARSIVITGTHGKTTTTSLTGWLLAHGGADPNVFIGGIAENFESSYRIGGGRDFVIEGDEYDSAFFDKTAKFLKYLPDIVVVNNIEFDHADIYPNLDAIRLAFRRLVNLVPRRGLLVLGSDNADALALKQYAHCRVETFGLSDGSDWQAHDLAVSALSTRFGVRRGGTSVGTFEIPLLGAYNVRNALAAIAVGAATGLSTDPMRAGLRAFKGVRRPPCPTISRTTRPRSARRSKASVPRIRPAASGRSSSLDPPHRAGACSRQISQRRSRRRIAWCCPPCFVPACRKESASRLKG